MIYNGDTAKNASNTIIGKDIFEAITDCLIHDDSQGLALC